MPRKLVGYILLSFLSFCFFTVVFNIIAIAQASAQQSPTQITKQPSIIPTPTIYSGQIVIEDTPITLPTPTIAQSQQTYNDSNQSNTQQVTATPIPPTQTPTPTVLPTATPTQSPDPTAATSPDSTSTDLETLFSKYSTQYSVSEDELKKIANCESGFNTNSDTGVYAGMFQFSASTWASVRGLMGLDPNPDLRKDPEQAIMTTAFMLSRGEENAWPNCH